jgi:NAD-dependent deacetylase
MLTEIIKTSKNIVFFGGAGMSTESNIPDFRSESGLYSAEKIYGHPPEYLLSYTCFKKKPELFFQYYKENLIHINAKPNVAHIALAKLEQAGLLSAIITQNIDGLHQAADSKNVIELHGSNHKQYCMGSECFRWFFMGEYHHTSIGCNANFDAACKDKK